MEAMNGGKLQIVIENPKGTKKIFVDSEERNPQVAAYPLKEMVYPVDYGSIQGYVGEDGDDLDVFVGSGGLRGFIQVVRPDIPYETKLFLDLTEEEFEDVKKAYSPVLIDACVLDMKPFESMLEGFRKV